MEKTDVLILGAGAAGMFCAIEAGRRGRRVLVLDRDRAPGEKIRISGGGRCNFTNLGIAPERFLSRNPRFALSALKRFTQWDFIARIDAAGIAWHEKVLGQLFCDGPATQIVDMLVRQMREAGVELRLGVEPGEIRRLAEGFEVDTPAGPVRAASVVVATGGKSIPKMGATGYAYRVAESFGLPVVETRPGLVPLTFAAQELERLKALAGLAVPARVSAGARASTRRCCSRIADCRGRRSCRPAPTGARGCLFWSISRRRAIPARHCARPATISPAVPPAPSLRGTCPSGLRVIWRPWRGSRGRSGRSRMRRSTGSRAFCGDGSCGRWGRRAIGRPR